MAKINVIELDREIFQIEEDNIYQDDFTPRIRQELTMISQWLI